MDFHTLARRDLQALCKKNKIPANITNVAMADALKALKIVEGIEEFMQQSQSGTAQSSQEMPAEVTSPFAAPTAGGRSTRCTNISKLASESVNPITRTRRTARKTQVKDADAFETPAMVPQTNRKKGVMASARLNMDSQLKECADESKKDFLTTPAVVTSRRKKAVESAVTTRAYSTRRSVRLAENSSVEISNEIAKDGANEEMSLKDGVDNNELSEITDGDAIKTVEEKSANKDEFEVVSIGKDEFEVVSDQRQDTSIVQDELEVVSDQKHDLSSVEIFDNEVVLIGKDECEVVSDQKQDTSIVQDELEVVSDHKHDLSSVEIFDNEEDMQLNEVTKKGENEEMNLKDSVDNFDELSGFTDGDAITTVEENKDEVEVFSDQTHDTSSVGEEIKMGSNAEEEIRDNEEDMQLNDINEVQDEFAVGEEIKMGSYAEGDICDNEEDIQLNDINEVQQNDGPEIEITVEKSTEELKFEEGSEEDEAAVAEFVENVILDSGDNFVVDELYFDNIGSHDDENKEELSNGIVDGGSEDVTDLNVTLDKLTELTLQQALAQEADLDFVDHLDIPELQLHENEPNESEKTDVDPLPLETDFVDHSDIQPNESKRAAADPEPLETETIKIEKADEPCAEMNVIETTVLSGFEGPENEPTEIEILKPEEGEKGAEIFEQIPTMKSGILFSDNKENIGSGGKLVIMRDVNMAKKSVVKNVGDLDDLSVRKLTKMLKEKLEITKKSKKTEIGNEAVMSRTALQAISENRMVDGAGN